MIRRTLCATAAAGLLVAGISGCATKSVDVAATGAQKVPGSASLYRFCDGPHMIYFSNFGVGDDEFEFFVYDGCAGTGGQPTVQNLPDNE